MTDDLNLHDEAAEVADRAVAELHRLSAEGIPQRIARIRAELFSVLEAAWLTGAVQFEALRSGNLSTEEVRKHALQMHQMTAQVEAALYLVGKGLDPLSADRCGEDFDLLLDTVLENASPEWVHQFFIGVYADQDRDEKIERLNELFRNQGSSEGQANG